MSRPRTPTRRPPRRTVADQLRAAAAASGLSAAALADAAGVDRSQVSRFLSGDRDPRLSTFAALADALGYGLAPVRAVASAHRREQPRQVRRVAHQPRGPRPPRLPAVGEPEPVLADAGQAGAAEVAEERGDGLAAEDAPDDPLGYGPG